MAIHRKDNGIHCELNTICIVCRWGHTWSEVGPILQSHRAYSLRIVIWPDWFQIISWFGGIPMHGSWCIGIVNSILFVLCWCYSIVNKHRYSDNINIRWCRFSIHCKINIIRIVSMPIHRKHKSIHYTINIIRIGLMFIYSKHVSTNLKTYIGCTVVMLTHCENH